MSARHSKRRPVPDLSQFCDATGTLSEVMRSRINGLVFGEIQITLKDAFERARHLARTNWFVGAVLRLRKAFCNCGLDLTPAEGRDAETRRRGDAEKREFQRWLADHEAALRDYINDVWSEKLILSNVISFWRAESPRPIALDPEMCAYEDRFGLETLKIKHGLTARDLKVMEASGTRPKQLEAVRRLLQQSEVNLPDPALEWYFKVFKPGKLGGGLEYPELTSVLQVGGEIESHEAGDAVAGMAGRLLIEHHQIGHEIKSGVFAGQRSKSSMTKDRSDAVLNGLKGKTGHIRMPTNWDHKISFVRVDPKMFAASKYEAALVRLLWWSQPIGQLITTKSFNPYLMDMLRALCLDERDAVGRHVEAVLNHPKAPFAPPVPVKLRWSQSCFLDSRLFTDIMKTTLAAGPGSQTSFLEWAGLDPERERERKAAEAALPQAQTTPIFDAHHGQNPASGGKRRGKKPGTELPQ